MRRYRGDPDPYGAALHHAGKKLRGPRRSNWGAAYIALGLTVAIIAVIAVGMILTS